MLEVITIWFKNKFADPELLILLSCIAIGVLLILYLGQIFAPFLAAIVITYLLQSIISPLEKYLKFPKWLALPLVYLLFISILLVVVFVLVPMLGHQFAEFVQNIPTMMKKFHAFLTTLPQKYPSYVTSRNIHELIQSTSLGKNEIAKVGKLVISVSVASLPNIISWLVYLFLVPLLVFFMLKDKATLLQWGSKFIPKQRGLLVRVWVEMQAQLGNYVRGKVIEMVMVGVVTYIGFIIFGLKYASLLAFFVGFSVLIPYVGMVIVTIPVVIIGLVQWGASGTFTYMLIVYFVIQALDANLLVPLLFSEAVNIHPVAIIAAVLFFGGIWGFWGLVFAIPLATLVKAILNSYDKHSR